MNSQICSFLKLFIIYFHYRITYFNTVRPFLYSTVLRFLVISSLFCPDDIFPKNVTISMRWRNEVIE